MTPADLPALPDGRGALPRRALLRGSAAAGLLFGLAACGGGERSILPPAASAAPPSPRSGEPAPTGTAAGRPTDTAAGRPTDTAAGPPSGTAAGPPSAPAAGPPGAASVVPGGPAVELARARTGRPEVALTFHGAGSNTLDRSVLETLAKGGARVTVLAVGTWLAQYPDAARMVTDLGHELGNHTWSHQTMSRLSVAAQREEIVRCRDRIAALTGGPGAWFRQSAAQYATAEQLKLAGAAGYPRVLSYNLDSLDWTDPGPARVISQLRKATAGSVVSMHLGHPGTLSALPAILAQLRERGLRPVTATQLFA